MNIILNLNSGNRYYKTIFLFLYLFMFGDLSTYAQIANIPSNFDVNDNVDNRNQSFGMRYMRMHRQSKVNADTIESNISFGQSLSEGSRIITSEDHTEWVIQYEGDILKQGLGRTVLEYIFEKPGLYKVKLYTPEKRTMGGCNHGDIDHTVLLTVSNVVIDYQFDSDYWQEILRRTKTFENVEIMLPLRIRYYDDKSPNEITGLAISVAGVNCTLRGRQLSSIRLPGGLHDVAFLLQGSVGSNVYVMVDFHDHDGRVQSHSIKGIIK